MKNMNSYNQTRKIMEELKLKVSSASSNPNKKVFVVVLEGTESEFDEIRKLGGVEIENIDTLSKLPSISASMKRTSCLDNKKLGGNSVATNLLDKSLYVSTGSVITEGDVAKLCEGTNEIVLKERGMITPLARDLAKKRGIKVVRVKS
jgi:hypothetical protein